MIKIYNFCFKFYSIVFISFFLLFFFFFIEGSGFDTQNPVEDYTLFFLLPSNVILLYMYKKEFKINITRYLLCFVLIISLFFQCYSIYELNNNQTILLSGILISFFLFILSLSTLILINGILKVKDKSCLY